jgi:hypothetical protein
VCGCSNVHVGACRHSPCRFLMALCAAHCNNRLSTAVSVATLTCLATAYGKPDGILPLSSQTQIRHTHLPIFPANRSCRAQCEGRVDSSTHDYHVACRQCQEPRNHALEPEPSHSPVTAATGPAAPGCTGWRRPAGRAAGRRCAGAPQPPASPPAAGAPTRMHVNIVCLAAPVYEVKQKDSNAASVVQSWQSIRRIRTSQIGSAPVLR